jgi:hypothetical protein
MQKIIVVIFAFLYTAQVSAQDASFNKDKKKVDKNLPYYDDKLLHYGFTLGLNSTRFLLKESGEFINPKDSLRSITSPRNTGFSLGFILNLKLGAYFDLRLLPTFSFYQRDVTFTYASKAPVTQTTESTFIEVPLLCKYKSQRHGNTRMYVVGGVKPGIEAGAKKKEKKDTDLRTSNKDLCIEYGFGFDIYYPLFKFSPELRFSHGLLNMLNKDDNAYANSLSRLSSHTITLYLHFE